MPIQSDLAEVVAALEPGQRVHARFFRPARTERAWEDALAGPYYQMAREWEEIGIVDLWHRPFADSALFLNGAHCIRQHSGAPGAHLVDLTVLDPEHYTPEDEVDLDTLPDPDGSNTLPIPPEYTS